MKSTNQFLLENLQNRRAILVELIKTDGYNEGVKVAIRIAFIFTSNEEELEDKRRAIYEYVIH